MPSARRDEEYSQQQQLTDRHYRHQHNNNNTMQGTTDKKPKMLAGHKATKRYSEDPSHDYVTPSTKYFFSKCESPAEDLSNNCRSGSSKNHNNKNAPNSRREYCERHPSDELSFVCLSCDNMMLCLKCLVPPSHSSHNVKEIDPAIEYLLEQISMKKLELNEKIEYFEMWQRRISDRKDLVADKWQKAKDQITETFVKIAEKLKNKEYELLQVCNDHYSKNQMQMARELDKLGNSLMHFKTLKTNMKKLYAAPQDSNDRPSEFMNLYNKIRSTLASKCGQSYEPSFDIKLDIMASFQEIDMIPVVEKINSMRLCFSSRGGGAGSLSPEIPQEFNNNNNKNKGGLLTNFGSLNTSRERKPHKKYMKTQQPDAGGIGYATHHFNQSLKRRTEQGEANTFSEKPQSRKHSQKRIAINTQNPAENIWVQPLYVTKFLEKQKNSYDKNSLTYEYQNKLMTSNSKLLSRTLVSQQNPVLVKKKESVPKERKERKTVNMDALLKSHKSSIIIQTKKKKS